MAAIRTERTWNVGAPLPRDRANYGRLVRAAKFSLLAAAMAVVLLVVVWSGIEIRPQGSAPKLADVWISGGQGATNARFFGIDRRQRPFSVSAARVVQTGKTDEGPVDLDGVKAEIAPRDGPPVVLTSSKGRYRRDAELLDLSRKVRLSRDREYELRTERARIEFRKGTASGNAEVRGEGAFGSVVADGFKIAENGAKIVFSGRSRLLLPPSGSFR